MSLSQEGINEYINLACVFLVLSFYNVLCVHFYLTVHLFAPLL